MDFQSWALCEKTESTITKATKNVSKHFGQNSLKVMIIYQAFSDVLVILSLYL